MPSCSNTCCVTKDTRTQWCFYSAFSFHPKSTIARWQRAMVLFGWNEKARWVTQRAMVLLFAITWRTILQSNGKDLLGCYIIHTVFGWNLFILTPILHTVISFSIIPPIHQHYFEEKNLRAHLWAKKQILFSGGLKSPGNRIFIFSNIKVDV